MSKRLEPSHSERNEHKLHPRKHVVGHRIVVEGLYLQTKPKRDHEGAARPAKIKYHEEFLVDAHVNHLNQHNALGKLLSDKVLHDRLADKDPEFRAINTHHIVSHENIYESDEEFAARQPKPEFLDCGKCPWNTEQIHDEIAHTIPDPKAGIVSDEEAAAVANLFAPE